MTDLTIFSNMDADRILKRAAEIEGSDDPGPVTIDELRSIASEAGFGIDAVERAIAEAQQAAYAEVIPNPVRRSGLVYTRLATTRRVPVEISSERLMRAVRLLQPYRDGLATVNLGAHEITWRDRKGLRFTLTSGGGITEVHVWVARVMIRRGLWTQWVEAAADRLEALLLLMAAQESTRSRSNARVALPAPETAELTG